MFNSQYSQTGELLKSAMETVYNNEMPALQQPLGHTPGQPGSLQLQQGSLQQQLMQESTLLQQHQPPNNRYELMEIGKIPNQSAPPSTGKKREADRLAAPENSKMSVPNDRLTSGSEKVIVSIPTSNKYAILGDSDVSVDPDETDTENLIEKTTPVFIHNESNHTLLQSDLNKFMKVKFSTKQYQNKKCNVLGVWSVPSL